MSAFMDYPWDKMSHLKLLSAWGKKRVKASSNTVVQRGCALDPISNLCLGPPGIHFMCPEQHRIWEWFPLLRLTYFGLS